VSNSSWAEQWGEKPRNPRSKGPVANKERAGSGGNAGVSIVLVPIKLGRPYSGEQGNNVEIEVSVTTDSGRINGRPSPQDGKARDPSEKGPVGKRRRVYSKKTASKR